MEQFKMKVGFKTKGRNIMRRIIGDLQSDGSTKVDVTKVEHLINNWYYVTITTNRSADEVRDLIYADNAHELCWQ